MRQVLKNFLLIFFTLITQTAFADGLLYQFPEDGAYVVFNLTGEITWNGEKVIQKGTIKMSAVGTVMEHGKKCRWLELKTTTIEEDGEEVSYVKLLVPEIALKDGKNAYLHRIRGWMSDGDLKTEKLDIQSLGGSPIFLCGPLKNEKILKPRTINSKLGKLKCQGLTGETEYESKTSEKIKAIFETFRHKKAPFGVVSTKIIFKTSMFGKPKRAKVTLTLKEVGKNAKSELPDAK